MDQLLDAARKERESAAYAALAKKFIKVAMTDVPVIPLYQPTLDVVMQPDIKGYVYMFHRQVDANSLYRG
jgi:peptide/nickel transport system substrate-binding protein